MNRRKYDCLCRDFQQEFKDEPEFLGTVEKQTSQVSLEVPHP